MQTVNKPELAEFIAQSKENAVAAKERLLTTFSFVPDEKLTWSPSESSRSALRIAVHTGLASGAFANIISGTPFNVPSDPAEFDEFRRQGELSITDRPAAVKLIEDATTALVAAIESVTPETFESIPDSPVGAAPMTFWMQLAADHVNTHAAQIDYLQTVWGDLQDHR